MNPATRRTFPGRVHLFRGFPASTLPGWLAIVHGGEARALVPEVADPNAVITAHNEGMGATLKTFPERILPALLRR